MSMYGTTTKRTRRKLSYADIEWNITHAVRIKILEDSIVKLVEWRGNHLEDDDYSKSKDLLNFAFDKYNDMLEGRGYDEKQTFCGVLNDV